MRIALTGTGMIGERMAAGYSMTTTYSPSGG